MLVDLLFDQLLYFLLVLQLTERADAGEVFDGGGAPGALDAGLGDGGGPLNLTQFRHLIYILPPFPPECLTPAVTAVSSPLGMGEVGGRQTWVRADMWSHFEVVAHEVGVT